MGCSVHPYPCSVAAAYHSWLLRSAELRSVGCPLIHQLLFLCVWGGVLLSLTLDPVPASHTVP